MSVETISALIGSLIHEPHAGLLSGILFGTKTTIGKELHDALIVTGTLHIVALSGMNISILVGFVNLFLLRFLKRPVANVATSLIIIGFISFVGPSPSVIRAAIMAGITLLGVSFGRQTWPIVVWILAVIIMLLLNPLWIGDLSFQLSVLATLGIILFSRKQAGAEFGVSFAAPLSKLESLRVTGVGGPPRRGPLVGVLGGKRPAGPADRFNAVTVLETIRLPTPIWHLIYDDLRVTLAAQVFTIPIILFQFHRISLVSPLSNLLIGWLMSPIMILGFLMVALGSLWAPLGVAIGWIVWVPLTIVIQAIYLTSRIPFASISW
jgi:competence protein ComEC